MNRINRHFVYISIDTTYNRSLIWQYLLKVVYNDIQCKCKYASCSVKVGMKLLNIETPLTRNFIPQIILNVQDFYFHTVGYTSYDESIFGPQTEHTGARLSVTGFRGQCMAVFLTYSSHRSLTKLCSIWVCMSLLKACIRAVLIRIRFWSVSSRPEDWFVIGHSLLLLHEWLRFSYFETHTDMTVTFVGPIW
jgi:hypothetical protein